MVDRPTKAHEYIFLMSKSARYYYDNEAVKEVSEYPVGSREDKKRGEFNGKYTDQSFRAIRDARNRRTVWTVATQPYSGAHFAVFPPKLIEPCIKAGCPQDGIVLDPFMGAGTTGVVCKQWKRAYVGIELNPEYIKMATKRINETQEPLF